MSLQEGWDDPDCYLGYIDKSMGSHIQAEQIIGRVLRQPEAKYYPDFRLNTCCFYIHVASKGIFVDILHEVQAKLAKDMPAVKVISTGGSSRTLITQDPKIEMLLPAIGTSSNVAAEKVAEVLAKVSDYELSPDSRASGRFAKVSQEIGKPEIDVELDWQERGEGLSVSVEWLLKRLIERQCPAAYNICDMDEPRFRRYIQVGSRAAEQLVDIAEQIVATFLEYTDLAVTPGESQKVGPSAVDLQDNISFVNALHPAYSGLRPDEVECAKAIDALGWTWVRNPENGGFKLPLLRPGINHSFYPDFVIWTNDTIWLVDPKGAHLIREAAAHKIIAIDNQSGQIPVKVCLITRGRWDENYNPKSTEGVSAWRHKSGKVNRPEWYQDMNELLKKVIGVKAK